MDAAAPAGGEGPAGPHESSEVAPAAPVAPKPINRLSEDVVNRVAAGEIIHRPASALKELLENSLDAGSTNIAVTVKDGGNKLLQITDNGCGIREEDLPILCERHTTSKIVSFDDLKSCTTFGFRGEALASMTYVARLTVTTQTRGALHALRAEYKDGQLAAPPRPCAGLPGTTVAVEDLFYNVPTRRKALKSASEEYGKVLEVVQRYALLRKDVAFSCRKQGEARSDLHAPVAATWRDRLRTIYGPQLAKQALELRCAVDAPEGPNSLDHPQFAIEGLASGPEYGSKKTTLVLFINGRLVDCSPLKRAVEACYVAALPKAEKPFCFLSVRLPLAHVDVNVHPTKSEVQVLFLEEMIASVQRALEAALASANATRTIGGTQQTLMAATAARGGGGGAAAKERDDDGEEEEERGGGEGRGGEARGGGGGASGSAAAAAKQQRRDNKLVRVDARAQTLDPFLVSGRLSGAGARRTAEDRDGGAGPGPGEEEEEEEIDEMDADGGGGSGGRDEAEDVEAEVEVGGSGAAAVRRAAKLRRRGGGGGGGGGAGDAGGSAAAAAAGDAGGGARVVFDVTECELTSVRELNDEARAEAHQGLSAVLKDHIFCGMADGELALLQHRTRLYLADVPRLSAELFRQLALQRFGRLRPIRVEPAAALAEMLLMALDDEEREGGISADDGPKEQIAEAAADLLCSRAEMLNEYFAIDIEPDARALRGLPLLLDQHSPEAERVPPFLLRLARDTCWEAEKECFAGVAERLGELYAVRPSLRELAAEEEAAAAEVGAEAAAGAAGAEAGGAGSKKAGGPPKSGPIRAEREWLIAQAVLPAARVHLRPPARFATEGCVLQIASLEQLYRVFERC